MLLCCTVSLCVVVLCCVSRGVWFCVLRWGWLGVGRCLVVLCGVVVCLVAFHCVVLPCCLLRCVVSLLLILVCFDGFLSCSVVLWLFLWPFPLLCGSSLACLVGTLVVWHCCVVWRRVMCCCVVLCSIVRSYGSCIVSWRYAWCVVVSCLGVLGCTLVCGVGYCHMVLCVVTWWFLVFCSMLCCVMVYRCLVVCVWVVYLVGGLVVVSCVSALRGVGL